tara:strand:- start:903 stop:1424 length:522 start_codon:yes stop_codon:yes gene_type:complete
MLMGSEAKCGQCGASVAAKAKFCPSCGAKVAVAKAGSGVTLSSVIEYLREQGEDAGFDKNNAWYGTFKILWDVGEERSQEVFVFPKEDEDGESEFDDLRIWSIFAAVKEVALKKVIELDPLGYGFIKLGTLYAIQTTIRPWQLKDFQALEELLHRIALVADHLEENLLGSDAY